MSKRILYGCNSYESLHDEVQGMVNDLRAADIDNPVENFTAREMMEQLLAKEEGVRYQMPEAGPVQVTEMPENPNSYSDGSLKHNKGVFWGVGGAGVWWPGRRAEDLGQEERKFAEYEELAQGR